jgi:4'-phosphopantetheinyl transferase
MQTPLPAPETPFRWRLPVPFPAPPRSDVHVWRIDLDATVPEAGIILSPDEQTRAARFVYAHHRRRFVAARVALRRVLADYLAQPPEALAFSYSPQGKPLLPGTGLHFNLSHSGPMALLAVARRRVGVDVEQIDPSRALPSIAMRFFSAREVAAFLSLPPEARVEGFFNAWTRKEAYIKAVGLGLSLGLDRFSVSLAPGEAPALLETRHEGDDARRWSMVALDAAPGYAAALLAEGHDWTLQGWMYRES